jgi:dienelactone hydrolase
LRPGTSRAACAQLAHASCYGPGVLARGLLGAATLALVIALVGLRWSTARVWHYAVALENGVPAMVYEPGPALGWGDGLVDVERAPAVVLVHGFGANAGVLSALARNIARAGYGVVVPELRGHGQNRQPFSAERVNGGGLASDVDAAVLYARSHPRFDGERVAVAGHSMGAGAVLAYATQQPSVSAVIVMSGGSRRPGTYPPPNTLVMWASGDPSQVRENARALAAELAGAQQVRLDKVYGDPARANAVKAVEIDGVNHLTLPYSDRAAAAVVEWLGIAVGTGVRKSDAADLRMAFSLIGLFAALVAFSGLARAVTPLAPRLELPVVERPLAALATLALGLAVGVLLASGGDVAGAGPLGFVPLLAGRESLAFFLISGGALAALLLRRSPLSLAGLGDRRMWGASGALFALSYLVLGSLLQPFTEMWLGPHRAPWAVVGALLTLPFFASLEWLLRSPGWRGVALSVAGRVLTLAAMLAGVWSGALPPILGFWLPALVVLFALLELAAFRLARVAPNPWLAGLFQAALVGWITAATFPKDA